MKIIILGNTGIYWASDDSRDLALSIKHVNVKSPYKGGLAN
jgi:hypothetical protein